LWGSRRGSTATTAIAGAAFSGRRSPDAGRVEQHFGGIARGARERRVAADQGAGERAFEKDLQLGGEGVGVPRLETLEQGAVPQAALLLELHRNPAGRVPGVAKLGDGVDVGAAAEAAVGDQALQPVLGWHPVLSEYEIKAVSAGEDAQGQVLVRCRRSIDEGPGALVVTGHGLSTDIIEASLDAYLVAVNKLRGAEIASVSASFVAPSSAEELP